MQSRGVKGTRTTDGGMVQAGEWMDRLISFVAVPAESPVTMHDDDANAVMISEAQCLRFLSKSHTDRRRRGGGVADDVRT